MDTTGPLARAREDDKLFYRLVDDVIVVINIWRERKDETSRRLYVRVVFSCVEGVIQVMKSACIALNDAHDLNCLNSDELAALREIEVSVNDNGALNTKRMRVSLMPNLLFTVRIYERIRKVAHINYVGDQRISNLRAATKIRDRLTHPHALADLQVSVADMDIVISAVDLFHEMTSRLFQARNTDQSENIATQRT